MLRLVLSLTLLTGFAAVAEPVSVTAIAETEPTASEGDAADDSVIWVNHNDPMKSLVVGTDKQSGLIVYDLDGKILQELPDGELNNVDLREVESAEGESHIIVTAGNRTNDTLAVYMLDPKTLELAKMPSEKIELGIVVYGSCMYKSKKTGTVYAILNSKDGEVEQWALTIADGKLSAKLARAFDVGNQTEGCVGDDELGYLYIGEEEAGIWKYGAEPGDGTDRTTVELAKPDGRITPDIEGLDLYLAPNGKGYLIGSNQGASNFLVYEREGDNKYIGTFTIDKGNGIDEVTGTDGISVVSVPLGDKYPKGLFVSQDDINDTGNQNFKYVSWADIAKALGID